MKIVNIAFTTIGLLLFAGCASESDTAGRPVRFGMARDDLKARFGEPLRVEHAASGGEDWYYRFASWKSHPTGESGTSEDVGGKTSYVTVGLEFSKESEELPVHISPEGYVIEPVPEGKVIKN